MNTFRESWQREKVPNHGQQHYGIGFHTPANVHYGFADSVALKRSQTLAAARAEHRHRFSTVTDPKILALLGPAWNNRPKENTETEAA